MDFLLLRCALDISISSPAGGATSACRDWGLDADSWTDFLLGLGLLADGSTAAEKACAPGAFQEKALTHVMS